MDKGKKCELKFKQIVKDAEMYIHRFYDYKSGVRVPQPADYFVYSHKLIFVECKEFAGSKLYFSKFRPSQFKGFEECRKHQIPYIVFVLANDREMFVCMMDLVYGMLPNSNGILTSEMTQIRSADELITFIRRL